MQYQEYGTEARITLAQRKKARLEAVYTVHQDAPFLYYFFNCFMTVPLVPAIIPW